MICIYAGTVDGVTMEKVVYTSGDKQADVVKADLSAADATTYDDFVGLFVFCVTSCVNNIGDATMTRFTELGLSDDAGEFDYNTMSAGDKAKVDSFLALADSLLP